MNYKQQLENQGYFIVENIFTGDEIRSFREEILNYIKKNNCIRNASGITIPDFIQHKSLSKTGSIKDNEKITDILNNIFDNNYRFCSHNDIGINRIVGWHKDKLNGEYSKYETIDIWSEHEGEKHEIVKVLIYLQDHSNNNDGLKIVPGSHLERNINDKNWIQLNPSLGNVIIFDQRITHRGMEKQVEDDRILVSFGFGKNNIFTDNFEKGTVLRQNKQNLL
jgi:ectoine hydroxylase-related dioxygenase (phytanoyl-CoA dioxygenase family)